MKLSLEALIVLDAIDRNRSFAAAASELHRVPSAITYTVRKLEQDLDLRLFDRSGRHARLTPAGQALLDGGRALLESAGALESRVRRVATGWETTLTIAVDAMVPVERLLPVAEAFYRQDCGTRLTLAAEVLGGTWDALLSGRADLIVGADSHGPAGGGYTVRRLGEVRFAFAVAPSHPVAAASQPVPAAEIVRHRAVAVSDSSRSLPPRSSGLITGQEVLAVPTIAAKIEAQCRGLGVGFVPLHLAHDRIERRELVVLEVEEPKPAVQCVLAWRSGHRGRALSWFARRVEASASILLR